MNEDEASMDDPTESQLAELVRAAEAGKAAVSGAGGRNAAVRSTNARRAAFRVCSRRALPR